LSLRRRALRLALPALAGLVALLAQTGRADAMGCHAPERPTLGLSNDGERSALVQVDGERGAVRSHQVRPTPCDREIPGETGRRTPTALVASAMLDELRDGAEPAATDGLRVVESDRDGPSPASLPPDRPPR
jgi:hypothetical protein